jgi:hypothetical protein
MIVGEDTTFSDIAAIWVKTRATQSVGFRADGSFFIRQHDSRPFPPEDFITLPLGCEITTHQVTNKKGELEDKMRVTLNGCVITE